MLSERRDEAAARAFFIHTIEKNGLPTKVVTDKSGSNLAGLTIIEQPVVVCRQTPVQQQTIGLSGC